MESVDSIKRVGFRRWYERQLIESHAYFVTCFCCMILVAALLETIDLREPGIRNFFMILAAGGGGALGLFAWGRYKRGLGIAEHVAGGATCPVCATYASWRVLDAGPHSVPLAASAQAWVPAGGELWLKVRCKHCQHEWLIE